MVSGGWVGVRGARGEEGVTAALAGARAPTPRPPWRTREGARGPDCPGGSQFFLLQSLSPGHGAGLPEAEEPWAPRGLKRGWGRRECCQKRKPGGRLPRAPTRALVCDRSSSPASRFRTCHSLPGHWSGFRISRTGSRGLAPHAPALFAID